MTGLTADILVAGAGPAGLALALQAHDHGADVRVIDRRPEAFRPSRALILHARTLEVLRPLGVTQALLARADTAPAADLRLGSRVVRVTLGDLALPDTAFPHLTLVRQMDVERVLAQALADRGVEVERGTELAAVRDEPGGVRAVLRIAGRIGAGPVRLRRRLRRPGQHRAGPGRHGLARPRRTRWRSCWPTPSSTAIWPATPPRSWPAGAGCCSPSASASGRPGGCSRPAPRRRAGWNPGRSALRFPPSTCRR